MKWILIFITSTAGAGSAEFDSQRACIDAKTVISSRAPVIVTICVPKA